MIEYDFYNRRLNIDGVVYQVRSVGRRPRGGLWREAGGVRERAYGRADMEVVQRLAQRLAGRAEGLWVRYNGDPQSGWIRWRWFAPLENVPA